METRRLAAVQTRRGETPGEPVTPHKRRVLISRIWTIAAWVIFILLGIVAYQKLPVDQILAILKRLHPGSLALLALINAIFLLLANLRWWLLVRAMGGSTSLLALVVYRLAGFGVSYFTPGPQFGGEPLQAHLLHRRQGLPAEIALSSVVLDRLVDLLANFTFLFAGSLVLLFNGLIPSQWGERISIVPALLFLFPAGHLLGLRLGKRPAAWLLGRFHSQRLLRVRNLVIRSEAQIAALMVEKPIVLGWVILQSVAIWSWAVFEYWFCLTILGVQAGWVETISALTAARFALLTPLPGGLGALEASQYAVAQWLGWGGSVGISIGLVIRIRDMLLALLGLGIGGFYSLTRD